jgi:hypothetical protein
MKRRELITEQGGWGVYVSLLLFCGIALVFSMPWATRVHELVASPWQPSPLVFFSVYVFLSGVVGLNRGAALAPRGIRQWRSLLRAEGQILFAHFLLVPHLVYVRVLLPGRGMRIPIVAAYALLLSAVFGLFAYSLEVWRSSHGKSSSGLRYAIGLALYSLPLLALFATGNVSRIAGVSPLVAVQRLLGDAGLGVAPIAFGVPAVIGLLLAVHFSLAMRRWKR